MAKPWENTRRGKKREPGNLQPERVRIKPPTKAKPIKFKITPEVRKELITIAEALPKIPKFIEGSDGKLHPQMVANSKLIEGDKLLAEDPDASLGHPGMPIKDDTKIDPTKTYIQRGKQVVYQNHLVDLNKTYQLHGKPGVQLYIDWVESIAKAIKESYEKAESNKATNPEPSI